jgi:geranylgeranyl reductase family protein
MSKKMIPPKTEVIIIGAGPAGSTLAFELARLGIEVLLLDKEKFPRKKTCAGGINVRTLRLLPFGLESVTERVITGISFTHKFENGFLRRYPEPLLVTVRRELFDNLLAQKAVQMGAFFGDGIQHLSLLPHDRNLEVETTAGTCCAQFVIGADGVRSTVAKNLDLMTHAPALLIVHSEVPASLFPPVETDLVHIDWGSVKNSYAYLFPKNDFLSMGVGGSKTSSAKLKKYQRAFGATRLQKEDLPSFGTAGFLLPLRKKRRGIHQGRCLLLGDAAGLVNPFTGEGIFYAVRSAQIVAPLVAEAVKERRDSLQFAEETINRDLMPEIEGARLFQKIFNLHPLFFHRKVAFDDHWWVNVAKILRGEKTLLDLLNKLGSMGSLLLKMAR